MPVIKSAKKKLRQDKKRTIRNKSVENLFRKMVKKAQKNPTNANIQKAVSTVDKAVKKKIIHKNKAARIKSSLSKLQNVKTKTVSVNKVKKTTKKTSK